MIGSLIGVGLKAIGGIFGGMKASEAMKSYKAGIERKKRENENWYNRRYNEDATQTASAQRALTKLREDVRRRNRAAAGRNAVMGGGTEAVAAEKEANNAAIADATSQIVAQGDARKDRIEAQYRQTDAALDNQLDQLEYNKSMQTAEAIKGIGDLGGEIADSFEGLGGKSKSGGSDDLGGSDASKDGDTGEKLNNNEWGNDVLYA